MLNVIIFLSKLIFLIFLTIFILWCNDRYWEERSIVNEPICRIAPDNVKRIMKKMGPYYDYKMVGDKLYVNTGDKKWRRLRYDRISK